MDRREFLQAGLGAALAGATSLTPFEAHSMNSINHEAASEPTHSPLELWYRHPASQWLEALPIGNGRLGAMVYGGVTHEQLQLNEGTLWAGGPHDYTPPHALSVLPEIRKLVLSGQGNKAQDLINAEFVGRPATQMPYQTVGNLVLALPGSEQFSDYRRSLDLNNAIATTTYTVSGVRYRREAFVSAVSQVIVVRLTADQPEHISFSLSYDTPQKSIVFAPATDTLSLRGTGGDAGGIAGKVEFVALARVLLAGGSVQPAQNSLIIHGADAVTLLIAIGTNYRSYLDCAATTAPRVEQELQSAARKTYERLKQEHVANYRRLYGRVTISLGSADTTADAQAAKRPTEERVATYHEGKDPQLAALHYQYGRYLLISCSREGGQPATLQGLWNDSVSPPWGSKYTININTEMNYWPAAPTNLVECYAPLFALLTDLSQAGQRTAQGQYGARGWVCHHNTDAWRGTAPVDGSFWGMWPMGGAWLCKNLWDHYEFTLDRDMLARAYPILKGATEFFLDTLVEEPHHRWLVTCPSVSPENAHHGDISICAGPTMDMQILRDLFDAVVHTAELLEVDPDLRAQVTAARARLAPMQIGKLGQLQEWLEDWDADAPEQQHRHVSHLYGLFPSNQITPRATPDLFAAARKSLEIRGDMATGWSLAWKINLWARLQDGNRAHKLLGDLLTPERTAPNLFDLHPPFQIDGNFGAVSGVTEMLLQTHTGAIEILPALPSIWQSGTVTGLRARGGFIVDIAWQSGKLVRTRIKAQIDGHCTVRYRDQQTTFAVAKGKRYALDATLKARTG